MTKGSKKSKPSLFLETSRGRILLGDSIDALRDTKAGSIDLISIFSGSREVYKPYNETEYDQKEDTEEKKFLSAHLAYTEKVALFFG